MSETHRAVELKTKEPRLLLIAALVALVGLADAVYLTALHLSGQSVRCTIITGCSEVLASSYASIGGVPLALVGAVAYFTAFSLAVLAAFGNRRTILLLRLLVAAMFATTVWLVGVQALVLGRFCEFCLLSAAVTVTLVVLVLLHFRITRPSLP